MKLLRKTGRSGLDFATALSVLRDSYKEVLDFGSGAYFSTHPDFDERIEAAEQESP